METAQHDHRHRSARAKFSLLSLAVIGILLCSTGASARSGQDLLKRMGRPRMGNRIAQDCEALSVEVVGAPVGLNPQAALESVSTPRVESSAPDAPQTVGTNFVAISLMDQFSDLGTGSIPPDTMGAVGPNHYVEIINSSVAIYTKSGTRLSHVGLTTFFTGDGVTPANGTFDPRVLYDRNTGRWFATAMERGVTSGEDNDVILAVSDTSDPTQDWDRYRIPVGIPTAGTTYFTDYSTLAVDANGVYFGMRIFPSSGASFAKIAATPLAPLLVTPTGSLGAVTQWSNITDMYSSPQPAHNFDAAVGGGRAWFVSSSTTVYGNVQYRALTWSAGVPSLAGSSSTLATPAYGAAMDAPASGSTTNVSVGDDRLQMAVIRNNRLWTTRHVGMNSSGTAGSADRMGVEWFELNVTTATPTLVQNGRIYDTAASSPMYYYYPSVMVNGQGHMAIGFSGSNASQYIAAYASGRLATDTLNTTQAIALVKAGEASYTRTDGIGRNRWGDYSYTTLDPNDDMTIWTIQEYAKYEAASTNIWGTWVAQLMSPAPTLNNPSGTGQQGQTGVVLNLTGTGCYDPGAGFANRLAVTLTGGATNGISNYNITYNSPTSVTVTLDIASNASVGPRNVVLTNPDGQTATVPSGFQVTAAPPEIAVEGNGIDIPNNDTTPVPADDTEFGTRNIHAGGLTHTFTIRNTGTTALTLGTVTITNGANFSVTQPASSSVAGPGSTTFTATFDPASTGLQQADISFTNNDSDESPFTFRVQGTGIEQDINVQGNGQSIVDGDTAPTTADDTDFGSTNVAGPVVTHTFTIQNTGTDTLNLLSGTPVTLTGSGDFAVTMQPGMAVLAPSSSTTFLVQFSPTATGTVSATVSIANDDTTESPYDFVIQGTGIEQDIDVQGNGLSIPDASITPTTADDTDFGSADVTTGTVTHTFTIQNTGTDTLTLTGGSPVSLTGSADFIVLSQPGTGTLAPTSSTTFQVRFDPSTVATVSATVNIANDDPTENPYDYLIQGTGTATPAPEIAVEGNGANIPNNDTTPTSAKDTEFGNRNIHAGGLTHTFTIHNTGTATLTLGTVTITNGANFSVTQPASSSVAASGSTTFTATFDPASTGLQQADISFTNNDSDETPFAFRVQGTGTDPEMNLRQGATNIADGGTHGYGSKSVGSTTDVVLTIENLGNESLTLTTPLTIVGADSSQFNVQVQPSSSVPASGNTTFTVRFAPTSAGAKVANIDIVNTDNDESPYTLNLTGTGIEQDINVQGNGQSIPDGSTTPTTADHTDFGSTNVSGGMIARTFTIQNLGSDTLNLLGGAPVSLTGSGDFVVAWQPGTSSISPSSSTTFVVQFDPSAAGLATTTVAIANDDPTENPYDYVVQGTGTEQDIDVQGNGQSIPDGSITPTTADHTDFGSTNVSGGTVIRTFTILNVGTDTLNLLGGTPVTVSGSADFTVLSQPGAAALAPSSSTVFQVQFDPSAAATVSATVSIANDDPTETPYDFLIQGTGTTTPEPEMDVQGNGNSIADGDTSPTATDHTDFGSTDVSSGPSIVRTFTIANTGTADLTLDGSPLVDITGPAAGDFSVTTLPSTPVASGGGSTTFQVTFTPSAVGARSATISIDNDDGDEDPYDFAIEGTGTGPEIAVEGNGQDIGDGDTTPTVADDTDFVNRNIHAGGAAHTFTVRNTGAAALTLGTVTVTPGTHFSVTQPASTSLASGTSTTFTVTFDPASTGTHQADISFPNNDNDEDPFDFTVQGTGVDPEIEIEGNGQDITDGDTSPSSADDTDFGNEPVAGGTVAHTFTVRNVGSGSLMLGGPNLTGAHAGDFSVTALGTSLTAGSSTSFTVTFDPSDVGPRSATVSVLSTDNDENPFTFDIQGTGTAPEIQVEGLGNVIANGDFTPTPTDDTDFGGVDVDAGGVAHTFTIRNVGTDNLLLTGAPIVLIAGLPSFTVTAQPGVTTVPPGGTTTFSVTFDPSAPGLQAAGVGILNDDSDESSYTYTVQGVGTDEPVMVAMLPVTCGTSATVSCAPMQGPDEYEFQASTDPAFGGSPLSSGWIPGLTHTFLGLSPGQTYYYRAHCRFNVVTPPAVSGWSASVNSFQAGTPALTGISPTSGSATVATPVTLTGTDLWGAAAGLAILDPSGLGASLTGTPSVSPDGTTVTGLSVPPGLPPGGPYDVVCFLPCGTPSLPLAYTVTLNITLTVESDPEINTPIVGSHSGTTPYSANMPPSTPISLTAPWMHMGLFFLRWKDVGNMTLSYSGTLTGAIPTSGTVIAEYGNVCDFYVDDDGDDNNPGTSPAAPMQSLQNLLDRYPNLGWPCGVVHMAAGTYPENVHIGPSHAGIAIMGAGDGPDPASASHIVGQGGPANVDVLLVRASGAGPGAPTTIQDVRVTSTGGTGWDVDPMAPVYGGVTLDATGMSMPSGPAKQLPGMLEYIRLLRLTATGMSGAGTGCGILLTGSHSDTDMISDVSIEGCQATDNEGSGILLTDAQVSGFSITAGPLGRRGLIWGNGNSGLLVQGDPMTPVKSETKYAGQFAPFAISDTSFGENIPYDIELYETDGDIDVTSGVAFVGAMTPEEVEARLWHQMDVPPWGLIIYLAPEVKGNFLTWDPVSYVFTLGGYALTWGTNWYPLGYPAGAEVLIDAAPGRDAGYARVLEFDLTGGDHGDAVPMGLPNGLYDRYYMRGGDMVRLAEASTLGPVTLTATWDGRADTTRAGRDVFPGIWVYAHLILASDRMERELRPAAPVMLP